MPGIVGILSSRPRPENRQRLETMVQCLQHEPFYRSGRLLDEELGLWVGWVGLAGTLAQEQPLWNNRREIGLILAAEGLATEARNGNGHSQGNGEGRSHLAQRWEEKGPALLAELNGWFSGVLVDQREKQVVLFNDRYGLGRLYVHEAGEDLYFASEAKALLKVLPELRRLNLASLAEAASCGCVLGNRSLFQGVSLLPGASRWTWRQGRPLRKEVYFRKEDWEQQAPISGPEFYQQLKETFARVLPRYLRDPSRLGMSLTGGLDGRMIMAWAGCPAGALPCYTFGGPYRDCADVRMARQIAEVCGQPHQVIPVGNDFLDQFPRLAEKTVYLSDGTMDVSGAVELYVNQAARQIAPVRLTGNYGSEIVRGNVVFKPRPLNPELYDPELVRQGQAAAETYAQEARGRRLSLIAFKQVPWHHYSRLSIEQSQLTVRTPYLDNELVGLMFRAGDELLQSCGPSLRLIAEGHPVLGRIPTDRGLLYRPVPLLTKARQSYADFTAKAEYAYDYGMPQWLARVDHFLAPARLERLFLGRHKFYHYRVWYRDRLAPYVKEILLDRRTLSRPFLRGANLEAMVKSHLQGQRNYTSEIHRMLTYELMQRQLLESS